MPPRERLSTDLRAADELIRGWRVVLAALCGIAFGVTGLFFYSTGIFLKPVAGEFGWSRAAVSTVSVVAGLALAATGPFIGRIVDRLGARKVAFASSLGLATGFLLLSWTPGRLPVYLSLVVLTVLLGAGASPVAYTRLVNLWFDEARGTALGLAQMATGFAGAILRRIIRPLRQLPGGHCRHGRRAGARRCNDCAAGPVLNLSLACIQPMNSNDFPRIPPRSYDAFPSLVPEQTQSV